jgi:hypothetical protein
MRASAEIACAAGSADVGNSEFHLENGLLERAGVAVALRIDAAVLSCAMS